MSFISDRMPDQCPDSNHLYCSLFLHIKRFHPWHKHAPIKAKSQLAAQIDQAVVTLPRYQAGDIVRFPGTNPERQKHFGSDINLAIMTDTPVSDCFKRQLIETISTELGCPVDIVNINEAPEPIFAEYIIGIPSVRRYKCRVARQTVLLR